MDTSQYHQLMYQVAAHSQTAMTSLLPLLAQVTLVHRAKLVQQEFKVKQARQVTLAPQVTPEQQALLVTPAQLAQPGVGPALQLLGRRRRPMEQRCRRSVHSPGQPLVALVADG